ncbi:peptide chain release factor N(5)-glutamine methyltransferase, partial [Candidatus Desantisbacteria bacterium CG07_land_8_20_14_0_80_39_15]
AVIKKYVDSPLIVDIGTGCGNIAIALAKSIPCFRIYATDISSEALELARENAKKNAVSKERISFLQGDLFKPLNDLNLFNKIDILVSNPPYIPSGEIENLPSEVLFEPRIAIDGEFDGLGFYRKIINESPLYLKNGGYLFLEIGFNQADEVKRLISKNSNFTKPDVVLDYMGIDRIIFTQKRDK